MLFIKRLKLVDFGVLKGTHEFNFNKGFNVISGRNGHGKTTILDAFSMLLFDDHEGSYEAYINDESTKFETELDFDVDNVPYTLKFSVSKKDGKSASSTRELFKDGNSLAKGQDALTNMADILDKVIGPFAFAFKQNGSSRITTCGDADRRNLLKKLWEIDFTKKVEATYDPKINALKDQLKSIDEQIYALENYVYNTIPIQELPVEEEVYENEKAAAEEIRSRIKMINSLRESNANWKKQYDTCELNIANTKQAIANIEQTIKDTQAKIDSAIQDRSTELDNAKNKFDTQKQEYENIKKKLEETIAELKAKTFMKQRLPILSRTNFGEILANKTAELNIANKNLAILQTGVCPTCGSNCTHKTEEFKAEVDRLTIEVADVKAKYDEEELNIQKYNEIELYNREMDSNQLINDQAIKTNEESLARTCDILEHMSFDDTYNSIMTSYNNANNAYNESISQNKSIIEYYTKEIEKYESDKVVALSNIKEIELSEADTSLDSRLLEIENEIKLYESIVAQNITAEKHNKEIEILKEENTTKITQLRNLRLQVVDEKTEYETAADIMLRKYPLWRVNRGVEDLTNKMNIFINNIYEKSLNVKFKPDKNVLKMHYGNNENRPIPIYKLSGAEKNLVDVSFINIFNQKINLGCICLDEYDAPMDKYNKAAAFEAVKNMENCFQQLFIISHSDDIKNYLLSNCNAKIISL